MEKLLDKNSVDFDFNDINDEDINMDYISNNYPILKKYVIILLDCINKVPSKIFVFKDHVFDSVEEAECVIAENQLSTKFRYLIYPILVIKDHEKLSDVMECLNMDNYIRGIIAGIQKQRGQNMANIISIEDVYKFNEKMKGKK